MDPITVGILSFVALGVMLFLTIPIGVAMALAGIGGTAAIICSNAAVSLFASTVYSTTVTYELSIVPLFVLMGAVAARSGLSRELYGVFNAWLDRLRGGLAIATVGACGAFAAICGSSLATAATMSRVALPEMERHRCAGSLTTGAIASGGVIGILTETSIGDLFVAGMVQGLLTVAGFMGVIALITRIWPDLGPAGERTTWGEKLAALGRTWAIILLFVIVIGGIYLGVFSGQAGALGGFVSGLEMSPMAIMAIILLKYLVLGCFLDALAMILLTVPIFYQIVTGLGFDAVWFGIIVVMVAELGLITPPISMNVFVIKGMAPHVNLSSIYLGVLPFVAAQLALIILVFPLPQLALWLPETASAFR